MRFVTYAGGVTALVGLIIMISAVSIFPASTLRLPKDCYWTSRTKYGWESGNLTIAHGSGGQVYLQDDSIDPECSKSSESIILSVVENQCPNSKAIVQSDIVYKGDYALKLIGTRRAKVSRWGETMNLLDAYYGAAFYIGGNFTMNGYTSLLSLRQFKGNLSTFARLEVTSSPYKLRLVTDMFDRERDSLWTDIEAMPLEEWFTVIIHVKTGQDGLLEFWINKKPFTDSGLGEHIGSWDLNLGSGVPSEGPSFSIPFNQNPDGEKRWMVVDEMVASATLEACSTFLQAEQFQSSSPSTSPSQSRFKPNVRLLILGFMFLVVGGVTFGRSYIREREQSGLPPET